MFLFACWITDGNAIHQLIDRLPIDIGPKHTARKFCLQSGQNRGVCHYSQQYVLLNSGGLLITGVYMYLCCFLIETGKQWCSNRDLGFNRDLGSNSNQPGDLFIYILTLFWISTKTVKITYYSKLTLQVTDSVIVPCG